MSPFIILISSGSSSNEVDLRNLPNLVTRSLSGNSLPSESVALDIDLNLISLKGRIPWPALSCLKNIGDPKLNLTITANTTNNGNIAIKRSIEEVKSKQRLKILYISLI
jgi:hypothetical protein